MPSLDARHKPPVWTILLVEDEDSVRQVTRHVLESAGYLVLEASGPEQAIDLFSRFEGTIHLLLTDLIMPTMNGAELAAQLKQLRANLITVFMSGYAATTSLLHTHLDAGAWYIQKPFTVHALLSRVGEALSMPQAQFPLPENRLPV